MGSPRSWVWLLCWLMGVASAAEPARIDVIAMDRKTPLEGLEVSVGGRADPMGWEADGGRWGLSVNLPPAADWREAFFTLKASADVRVIISFMGPDRRDPATGKRRKIEMEYERCLLNGKPVFDDRVLVAWHDQRTDRYATLERGKEYRFTVRYRQKPDPDAPAAADIPLALAPFANMGYADDAPGDGKGGWTDQGEQDMRRFDFKAKRFAGIGFALVDPARNGGKAVLTFASEKLSPVIDLRRVDLDVPAAAGRVQYLYLLHAAAWGYGKPETVGRVAATLDDGTEKTFELKETVDVGDWYNPSSLPNGLVQGLCPVGDRQGGLYLSRIDLGDAPRRVRRVGLAGVGKQAIWVVAGATLSNTFVDLAKLGTPQQPVTIAPGKEFRPVDMGDLNIRPGSALDFAFLTPPRKIDETARLAIRDGRFVLAADPSRRIRLAGCSVNFRTDIVNLDHKGIEDYVALARRQGYTMLRAHFLDAFLMWGAKEDLEFVPEHLDRFQYLVHRMKEAGLYLSLDAMSAPSGFRKLKTDWSPVDGPTMQKRLFVDPGAREQWKRGVARVLTAVNPYTKTRLMDDPVLVNLVLFNEQDIDFISGDKPFFMPPWKRFLTDKYGSEAAALEAYGQAGGTLDGIVFNTGGTTRLAKDSRAFLLDLYREMDAFYTRTLAEIGFKGWTTQHDCNLMFRFGILRSAFPVVAMHSYHAHPSNYIAAGSKITQDSSVAGRAHYLTLNGSGRFLDRPFMITEIGQVFWNRYRFEQGLVLGAYAAFQDYDCLTQHAGPVMFKGYRRMNPFGVGSDPVNRATEAVSTFLYLSGTVAPAPRAVEFELEAGGMADSGLSDGYPARFLHSAQLIARSGIRFADLPRPEGIAAPAGLETVKVDPARIYAADYGDEVLEALLANGNRSRPKEGFFVTDTGQITLDADQGRFTVVTPRAEGASSTEAMDCDLPHLKVAKATVPGSASLLALDGKPLGSSRRLLLVVAGDALNNGMRFADAERTTLLDIGAGQLLQTFQAEAAIVNDGGQAEVHALRMNGERMERLAVSAREGGFAFRIDTAALKEGPAVFFEIVIR